MNIFKTIEEEVMSYLGPEIEIAEGVKHSQYKLIRRIMRFKNRVYPKGKITNQARYKYWYDIIQSRINSEVKNIDIDTENALVYSENTMGDFPAVFICNLKLREWMRDNNQGDKLNAAVEMFSGDGNVVFKKTKTGYELFDPINFFVVNQTAETLNETSVIERYQLTQSELRKKDGVWDNVQNVIENCGDKYFSVSVREKTPQTQTTNPYYEIFERNGEVTEKELFEAQGKEGGREDVYLLAKIIVAGMEKGGRDHRYVLYAEKINSMEDVYEEAHRGPYKGRWWREGLYELLFDHQVRANEIGNQIARGLEWASKAIFSSSDKLVIQNILTDLADGDIIRAENLQQVSTRMQGFDQLIADWNRNNEEADKISNSYEIVRGESMPSGTPFSLASLMDSNAGKLFVVLRQRLTIPYKRVFKKWVMPKLIKDLKMQDIIKITGDENIIRRFKEMVVGNWYIRNLINIGPHNAEMAELIKEAKMREIEETDPTIKNIKEIWEGIMPRLNITITGENFNMKERLETLTTFVQLEADPMRRAYILDTIYQLKGIPTPPEQPQPEPQQQQPQQPQQPTQ